jgi:hypothetical protein
VLSVLGHEILKPPDIINCRLTFIGLACYIACCGAVCAIFFLRGAYKLIAKSLKKHEICQFFDIETINLTK